MELVFRRAGREDLEAIVAMLADDELGRARERLEQPLPTSYEAAFAAIDRDPNNELIVACLGDELVGTLQLTYTPSISHQGSWRATVESVSTVSPRRGQGIGAAMMQYAIDRARERGCAILQLSTNKQRRDAHRFYERLGFASSHEGMKLKLS